MEKEYEWLVREEEKIHNEARISRLNLEVRISIFLLN
jgi:hypothetical protein